MKPHSNKKTPSKSFWDIDITWDINGDIVCNCKSEKLLGVIIDYKLTFEEHITEICNKSSRTPSNLARISSFMKPVQKRQIMKASNKL